MNNEVWKTIEGFDDDYQVSDLGRIRSRRCVGRPNKKVKKAPWRINKPMQTPVGYQFIRIRDHEDGQMYNFSLHRLVYQLHHGPIPDGLEIDHINRVKNDNRVNNFRVITKRLQHANTAKTRRHSDNKYKGVYPKGKRWAARITVEGRNKYLGSYVDETDAAKAYDVAAIKYFGEFACTNNLVQ